MTAIKVFWLEPTDRASIELRRFVRSSDGTCAGPYGYHNASRPIGKQPLEYSDQERNGRRYIKGDREDVAHDDPRWPSTCDGCGYVFVNADHWQVNQEQIYRRPDTGEEWPIRHAPLGAMWDAWWMPHNHRGLDGICLLVKTPGGDWMVDSEASNCTDKAIDHPKSEGELTWHERTHFCWVRHGDPRTGNVHVDKLGGPTCGAGSGSILIGGYHGFLHHGYLTDC